MDAVAAQVRGRPLVLAGFHLTAGGRVARRLGDLAGTRPLIVAHGRGSGPEPDPADADWIVVEERVPDILAEIRAGERLVAHPPAEALAAIERHDPERRALVVVPFALGVLPAQMAGRRIWGHRPPEWVALEDKLLADGIWDEARVPHAPSAVVPAEAEALRSAAARLDRGAGTVWAAEARDGFHGGATGTRWVRGPADEAEAIERLRAMGARVRVMPFVEGVPCSVHGIVVPDGVAAVRPVEMVVLRAQAPPLLRYCGAATYWDPPEEDREAMRAAARRVGEALRSRVGFRGVFTLDGVLGDDGFVPTEVNPRYGIGMEVLTRGMAGLDMNLANQALIEGARPPLSAAALESGLVAAADRVRGGGGWLATKAISSGQGEHPLVREDGVYRRSEPGEEPDATVLAGPSNVGGFVRFEPAAGRAPAGPPLAPLVAAGMGWADRELDLGIGPLAPAREARRPG
ncbi:MAG TPA: ATP-grasp domain-containing protein [Miltoncostaeaceae bacterium]|nr:ATP-grasp domain-containing protein [Miltoncostaeaceae bacterium]